jgi:RHS repeat-associated protein
MTGSFAYDSEGKLTAVTYPAGTAVGQLAALTVNYTYDSMSRLTGASDTEQGVTVNGCSPAPPTWNGAVSWASNGAYNAAGQLIGLTELGNITAACTGTSEGYFNQGWQYNSLNQLSEIDTSAQANGYPSPSASPGLAAYFFARYHFSATQNNGQISQTDDARLAYSIGYQYDGLKRLTATTGTQSQAFGYDGFGNLTAKSKPANSAEPVFPGVNSAKNQLTGVSYDLNGNATALNGYGLTYDMENRLISATGASATETSQYDASNHRIERSSTQGYDYYYFYGPNGNLLSEFQLTLVGGSGYVSNLSFDSVYFGEMLLGTTQLYAGTEYSSIVDRLGTGHPGYAYGTDIGTKTGSPLVDFATYLNDSVTGFQYADQRWYSAGFGRFLTVDPYGGSSIATRPASWNRYAYVSGDTINNNDPSGLCIIDSIWYPDGYPPCPVNSVTVSAPSIPVITVPSPILPSVPGPIKYRPALPPATPNEQKAAPASPNEVFDECAAKGTAAAAPYFSQAIAALGKGNFFAGGIAFFIGLRGGLAGGFFTFGGNYLAKPIGNYAAGQLAYNDAIDSCLEAHGINTDFPGK